MIQAIVKNFFSILILNWIMQIIVLIFSDTERDGIFPCLFDQGPQIKEE